MSKILSIKNSIILIIISFLSISIATYIENSESKKSAWEIVYSSFWFEFLFYLIVIALSFNIVYFKMYVKEKLPSFIFHMSFILIIIGAVITKHYSYKGQMFIPVNKSSDKLISHEKYLQIKTKVNNKDFNVISEGIESFDNKITINNKFLELKDTNFIKYGRQTLVKDEDIGKGVMEFEILTKNKREIFFFEDKDMLKLKNIDILFNIKPNDNTKPYFKIDAHESKRIQFISNIEITTNFGEKYEKNKFHEFHQGIIYNLNGHKLLVSQITTIGHLEFIPDESGVSALIIDVKYNGKTKEVALVQKGDAYMNLTSNVYFDNTYFEISFGRTISSLPFSIKLNKYNLENYAGSTDIYTYESNIEFKNKEIKNKEIIKINKPLTYGFFTIFQTKYKKHDATVLDINYNPGVWFIYLGYILLILGLVLNLLNPNSRFRELLSSTNTT